MDASIEALAAAREHTILGTLGIDLLEAGPERVVLRMPVGPPVHQPYGFLHGGASVVLAETTASIGAWLAAGREDTQVFGIEINASHLLVVRDGAVTCTGTPVRQGRSVAVWQAHIEDEHGRLVSIARCTLAVRPAGVVGGQAAGQPPPDGP